MELKKLFRVYKTILIFIVVILASLMGFLFAVVPLGEKTFQMAQDMGNLSSDITTLRTKTTVLQSLDEGTLRTNLLALSAAVPSDKSITTVMTTIDGVSATTGVSVGDVTIQKPGSLATESAKKLTAQEAKVGSNVLPVSVVVRGTFDQIRSFLGTIAAVRRYFRVVSFSVSFGGAGTSAQIELNAFYLPYPTSIGGVGHAISALSDKEQATIDRISALPLESPAEAAGSSSAVVSTGEKSDPFSP